jgi:hypothetical protein
VLLAAGGVLQGKPVAAWSLTAVQGIVAIVMVIYLQVLAPEFKTHAVPTPPEVASAPSGPAVYAGDALFGGEVRLTAVSGQISSQLDEAGNQRPALDLWLTWNALNPIRVPFMYSVRPVAPDGSASGAPVLVAPFADAYPMTCWRPRRAPLVDQIRVPLTDLGDGKWWVDLALIDPGTHQPLSVADSTGSLGHQLRIGPFQAR